MDRYVKLISETEIEYAPSNKGNVINYNYNIELMLEDGYKLYKPTVIPETNRKYHIIYLDMEDSIDQTIVYDETQEEADEREVREERERLDALTLTPADAWRALYKAKQMRSADLLTLIEEQLTGVDMNLIEIEFGASLFYRGAKLGNGRLFDVIAPLLGYTSEDMDYLFEHKELP